MSGKRTPGPWKYARLVDDDGKPLRSETAVEYIAECIRAGGEREFFGVYVENYDGEGKPADICHTGNGRDSLANAEFIVRAVNMHEAHERAAEKIERLEGDLASARETWGAMLRERDEARAALAAAQAREAALVEWARKSGHRAGCDALRNWERDCDCGLRALLASPAPEVER